MIDYKAFAAKLDQLITSNTDWWGGAVRALYGDEILNDHIEFKRRREMFKMVFFQVFRLRAPQLVADSLEYLKKLVIELRKHGAYEIVTSRVDAAIRAEEEACERSGGTT